MKKLALLIVLLVIPTTILISMEYNQELKKLDEYLVSQAQVRAQYDPDLAWVPNKMLLWLKSQPTLNAQDELGNTRLHYAAFVASGPAMIDLINAGIDPRIKNNHGQDIFNVLDFVLLTLDSRLNELNRKRTVPPKNDKEKAKYNRLKQEYQSLQSTLNKLKLEYQKILRIIAKHNVLARFNDDETLLHKAVRFNDELLVIDLVKHIDPNAKNSQGITPLMLALTDDPKEIIIDQLLTHDANPNIQDNLGNTALHTAARDASTSLKIVNQLMRNGAKIDITNTSHENAVHVLLHRLQDEAKVYVNEKRKLSTQSLRMEELVKKKKLIETTLVTIRNQAALLFILLNGLHNKNAQDDFGNSPLYYLTLLLNNPEPIQEVLLPTISHFMPQFNTNTQNKEGFTPLHAAVNAQNLPMVRLLLQHGASPTIEAYQTKSSPVELAQQLYMHSSDENKAKALNIFKELEAWYTTIKPDLNQALPETYENEQLPVELQELALYLQHLALSLHAQSGP